MLIRSRRIVSPDGAVRPGNLRIEDGMIVEVDTEDGEEQLDVGDLLVAPGLVDIHGDAFERQLMPRPGVMIDLEVALLDTDRQLASNGITTTFHGITWSWEPGLRSVATGRAMIDALDRLGQALIVEHRAHLRFETHNHAGLDEALDLLEHGRLHLVAFNDHTPEIMERAVDPAEARSYALRGGVSVPAFRDMALGAAATADDVPATVRRLAAACTARGVPMLSHDDASPAERAAFRELGATLCEFPMNRETAEAARAEGDDVVMGAPNVMRGGSHLGWASAAEMVQAGLCTILASDYYYPALLQAPYRLAQREILSLGLAWRLVSEHPARAAGLTDRGVLEPGKRADLVVVDDRGALPPRIVSMLRAGREVYRLAS